MSLFSKDLVEKDIDIIGLYDDVVKTILGNHLTYRGVISLSKAQELKCIKLDNCTVCDITTGDVWVIN